MEEVYSKDENRLEIKSTLNNVETKSFEQLEAEYNQAVESLESINSTHAQAQKAIQETIDLFNDRLIKAKELKIMPDVIEKEITPVEKVEIIK